MITDSTEQRRWAPKTLSVVILSTLSIAALGYISSNSWFIPDVQRRTSSSEADNGGLANAVDQSEVIKYTREQDIQHWCLDGTSTGCPSCIDPFIPVKRDFEWFKKTDLNRDDALGAPEDLDVVFLGDSITEIWHEFTFSHYFSKDDGGSLEGLGFGIFGDRSQNLLWRIKNREITPNLDPKVFVVLVGTNDLGGHFFRPSETETSLCSVEVVVTGILQVVKELKTLRPNTPIVVSALLPRSEEKYACMLYYGAPDGGDAWAAIQSINSALEEFCAGDDMLHYFDVGANFLKGGHSAKKYHIAPKLMADCLHPTLAGYKILGQHYTEKIHELIDAYNLERDT